MRLQVTSHRIDLNGDLKDLSSSGGFTSRWDGSPEDRSSFRPAGRCERPSEWNGQVLHYPGQGRSRRATHRPRMPEQHLRGGGRCRGARGTGRSEANRTWGIPTAKGRRISGEFSVWRLKEGQRMHTPTSERYKMALEAKAAELSRTLRNRNFIAIEHTPEECEQMVLATQREMAVVALDRDSPPAPGGQRSAGSNR